MSAPNIVTDAQTGVSDAVQFPGGQTIDNVTIGATTPGAATFTTLTATTGTISILSSTVGTISNLTALNIVASADNAITAFAGGGQGSATALTAALNTITTCATAGDSVKLPPSIAGSTVTVINSRASAAYANVFPYSGESIDALAVNTAVSLPIGGTVVFRCTVAGVWQSTALVATPKFTTGTTTTTFAAGQLTGGSFVTYNNTQGTPGSIATRTATQMAADDPYFRVGGTYILRIKNGQGTGTLTVTAGVGVTLTGTMTIAINTFRDFQVTYTSATALVIQSIGTGTDS